MIINPIIPIWIMAIICVVLLVLKRKGIVPYIRQVIIVVLVFVINLRPMIPDDNMQIKTSQLDLNVMFVVDTTLSMVAQDYDGKNPRLDGVKKDCSYIIDELAGARFSLVTYDNVAKLASPYTNEIGYIKNAIDVLYPMEAFYARGTAVNLVKPVMKRILKRSQKENVKTVVFFISDGENNTSEAQESFTELASYIDGGAVLGYGTTKGGEMYEREISLTGREEYRVVRDPDDYFKAALSKIDEGNLKKLSSDMNISYINMNTPNNELKSIIKEVKNGVLRGEDDKETQGYKDIYQYFAIPLLLIIVYEFIYYKRRSLLV